MPTKSIGERGEIVICQGGMTLKIRPSLENLCEVV